jgi:hypothetical protein
MPNFAKIGIENDCITENFSTKTYNFAPLLINVNKFGTKADNQPCPDQLNRLHLGR